MVYVFPLPSIPVLYSLSFYFIFMQPIIFTVVENFFAKQRTDAGEEEEKLGQK